MTHLKQQKHWRSLEEILELLYRDRRSQLSQRQFIVGEGIYLAVLHQYLRRAKAGNQVAAIVDEERRTPVLDADGVKFLVPRTVATKDVAARKVVARSAE